MQANTANGNLTAADTAITLPLAGYGAAAIQLTGTFSATVTFEASVDSINWRSILGTPTTSSTQASTATNVGLWFFNTTGLQEIRARCSAYTSGTIEIKTRAVLSSPASPPGAGGGGGGGTSSDFGAAFPATGTAAGFIDPGGNMAGAEVNADGELLVAGTFSSSAEGPTGAAVPANAMLVGVSDEDGNLAALASVVADYNSTSPPVVPVSMLGIALPGAGGPVAGGTATNPIRINPTGTTAQPASQSGTWNIGTVTTVTAVTAITNALPAGTNNIGDVDVLSVVPGTGATNLGKAEDSAHASQDVGVMALAVSNMALPTQVTYGANGDYSPISVDLAGNSIVVGNVGTDVVDAGSPVKIGAIAFSPDGSTPGTAVAELDRTNLKADLDGRLFVNTAAPRWWSFHSDGSSALTDQSVQADPGDGFQIVITSIIFSTGAATACNIFFEEGSTKILGPWYLEAVAGRGVMWVGEKKVTASTALTVTTSAAIAQSLDVQGYIQAV